MTIIRSKRPESRFTIISNKVCLDSRLSMRGLGLLVRLLSRPDNWSTNGAALSKEFGCGREQMQAALRELVDCGYMELVKNRQKNGQISSVWHVYDEPKSTTPDAGKPEPGNPYAGDPVAFNKTDLTSTENKIQPPNGFCDFWSAYPRKIAKPAALRAWKAAKLKDGEIEALMQDVEAKKFSEAWEKEGGKYVPHPATYINQRRWEDEQQQADESPASALMRGAI